MSLKPNQLKNSNIADQHKENQLDRLSQQSTSLAKPIPQTLVHHQKTSNDNNGESGVNFAAGKKREED